MWRLLGPRPKTSRSRSLGAMPAFLTATLINSRLLEARRRHRNFEDTALATIPEGTAMARTQVPVAKPGTTRLPQSQDMSCGLYSLPSKHSHHVPQRYTSPQPNHFSQRPKHFREAPQSKSASGRSAGREPQASGLQPRTTQWNPSPKPPNCLGFSR